MDARLSSNQLSSPLGDAVRYPRHPFLARRRALQLRPFSEALPPHRSGARPARPSTVARGNDAEEK